MEHNNYPINMETRHKLLVNYRPKMKYSGTNSEGITFETNVIPRDQKENQRLRVSGAE